MVSVQVDWSTQKKRHFIGINLQVVVDGNLQVIIAAVNGLLKGATVAATRKNIVSCLAEFGILGKQIYSLTTWIQRLKSWGVDEK